MESEGRKIHSQAAQAREDGESIKALKLTDEAMEAYQKAGDSLGFAEIQAERFLSLRHLFEKTDFRGYLILAKYAAMASVELAEESEEKKALAIPLFNLAKAQETLGEFEKAVQTYRQALENIENNPPASHNRLAIKADFKIHLFTCEYKAGDKSVLSKVEEALKELEEADEVSDYNKLVWVSGAHMRMAEMLREDNPKSARGHLDKAKEIIDSDERLKLRKAQWEKLNGQIHY